MAEPVKLVVWLPTVSPSCGVVDPFWVFIHAYSPKGAKLDDPIIDCIQGGQAATVSPSGGQDAGPYKAYCISGLGDKCLYRMHVAARDTETDASKKLDDAYHVCLFTRYRPRCGDSEAKVTGKYGNPVVVTPTDWPNAHVQSPFVIGGTVTPSTSQMSAWVTLSTSKTTPGTACDHPPGCDWAFQFQLNNGQYPLTIQAISDQVYTVTGTVTVGSFRTRRRRPKK
jgi:hypothetical protein